MTDRGSRGPPLGLDPLLDNPREDRSHEGVGVQDEVDQFEPSQLKLRTKLPFWDFGVTPERGVTRVVPMFCVKETRSSSPTGSFRASESDPQLSRN